MSLKRPVGLVKKLQRKPHDGEYADQHANGVMFHAAWSTLAPTPTTLDWTKVDHAVEMAGQNEKQIGLTIVMLSEAPAWMTSRRYHVGTPEKPFRIFLPWEPVGQAAMLSFQTKLYKRYDGKIDYACLTGIGATIESYMHSTPEQIGETMESACTKWSDSCNAIIDTAAHNLHSTPFIFSLGVPFAGRTGQDALKNVVNTAMARYPNMGTMADNLNANSTLDYFINVLVNDYADTHPCGMEFLCSGEGFKGHELGGTVEETLEAGIAILKGRGFIHMYEADLGDPANATMLQTEAAKLR